MGRRREKRFLQKKVLVRHEGGYTRVTGIEKILITGDLNGHVGKSI